MPSERDLFANFERMRREMDELFGDVFDRRLTPRRHDGFMPAVDVYYAGDPPRAVVRADLAGIDPNEVELEIRGRELVLAGTRRPPSDGTERVYQQLEIEHGPFRREVSLGAQEVPDGLPVLPLRDAVTFPDTLTPLAVGQERSIQLVNDVLAGNRMLVMVASKDAELETPGPDALYEVGVVGAIARMMKVPDGTLRILVQGA